VSGAPARIGAFGAALALGFGGAAVAGGAIDPQPPRADATPSRGADGHEDAEGGHGMETSGPVEQQAVRGLAVAEHGLRVQLLRPELRRDRTERFAFRILDARGAPVRGFDIEHTKRMHLVVVRRDLTGFRHLHPTMAADGTWSTSLRLRDAGFYRIFADFSRDGEAQTLGADVRVDGPADLQPLPAPAPRRRSDRGDDVGLDTTAVRAGRETELRFTITRAGRPVAVEPYLGAGGHLVALRDGDLAFLHVHPLSAPRGPRPILFMATFPSPGRYRLFLQFQDSGRVHTVAFTQEVT
jgi:hypothetical protein